MEKISNLNININRDDPNLNDLLICWDLFGQRPNKIIIHNTYSTELFSEVFTKYIKEKTILTEIIPNGEEVIINDKLFTKLDDDVYATYVVVDRDNENSIISDLSFLYKEDSELVEDIIEELNSCIMDFSNGEECGGLNTVSISQDGIMIDPIESKVQEDFDMFYSKKTHKEINKLIKNIKNSNRGLSILLGERGTGKTSAINYISSKIDNVIIFIPNNMIENTINNPDFKKFLKSHHKSVIVIDDCEMLFNEFFNKSNLFVNNLIQMIDGIDSIEVNVISIFNVDDDSEIDHTLLECNNLLKVIRFDNLSSNESTELSEHLGFNKKYKNKMRVLDVVKNKKFKEEIEIGL